MKGVRWLPQRERPVPETGIPQYEEITQLLERAGSGDPDAGSRLIEAVYTELRGMAHRQLQREHGFRTVSTTELVHEAYLKIAGPDMPAESRAHFFSAASRAMRQVLIDMARKRNADKRGGDVRPVTLDAERLEIEACAEELLVLDEALTDLALLDPRLGKIVEFRFFGGLSVEETAFALGVSPRTVKRDWRKARAWLFQAVSAG